MTDRPDPTRVIDERTITEPSSFDCPRCGAHDAQLDRLHACPVGPRRNLAGGPSAPPEPAGR